MVYTITSVISTAHSRLMQFLLPARCVACARPAEPARLDLCADCHALLPINQHACRCCAQPLPATATALVCGRCLRRPPPYAQAHCAFEYAYPVQHLIRRAKYAGSLSCARVLAQLLAHSLKQRGTSWPACFIPMPLHARRYRQRGYNQVIEIGRHLAGELKVPMRTDLVSRHRATAEQAGLSRRARRKNMRGAFAVDKAPPAHVALLDDVITTGSTVNELAQTLRRAGVAQVEVWGVARATLHRR